MFSRIATLLPLAALVAVASAAPSALDARDGSCSSGANYCCNQVFSTPQQFTGVLGGLLSVLAGVGVNAGLACDPITIIGGGVQQCITQSACCTNNNQNGLVNVQCVPVAV